MTYGQPIYAMPVVQTAPYQHYNQEETWKAAPPPSIDHKGEIVVVSSSDAVPDSPITCQSFAFPTHVSAAGTDVSSDHSGSMASYNTNDRNNNMMLIPFDDSQQAIQNPSALPKQIRKMKKNRRRATVGAGVVGGVVGLVTLGPVGAIIGGTGSALATKHIGKRRERKRLEKLSDREIARQCQNAPEVPLHASESAEVL